MNITSNNKLAAVLLIVMTLIGIPIGFDVLLSTTPQAAASIPASLGFSLIYLAIFFVLFRFTSLWPKNTWTWMPAALLWGAFPVALWVKLAGPSLGNFTKQIGMPIFSASLGGALPEEIGKFIGVVLIALVFTQIKKPWHVFIVALFVGLGFTIAENIGYAASGSMLDPASDATGAINMWITRSKIGFGAHSIYTAIATWGFAQALFSPQWSNNRKVRVTLGWLFTGFILHFIWNSSPTDPLINIAKLIIMLILTYGLFIVLFLKARKLARKEQQA